MATRSSGKKVAASITAVVALGSFSVTGVAALAVGAATPSHTVAPSTVDDSGTTQNQRLSPGGGGNGYRSGESNSEGSSVQPGHGGIISGKSAGS